MKPRFVIDADAHVTEQGETLRRFLPEPWNRLRAITLPNDGGFNRDYFNTLGKIPRPTEPESVLRDLDAEGIDMAILYPTLGLRIGDVRDPDWEAAFCQGYNDWLAQFCSTNPDRLKGVALVPLQEPKRGCAELDRAVEKLGMVGVMVPSYFQFGPPNLGDQHFDVFYAEAERLGVPVAVHAHGGPTADTRRFRHFLQVHLCSHVIEQMTAVVATVIGGVFERFPNLKMGFMEAGCSWVPFWLEHMDEEFEKRHQEVPWLKQKPSEYVRHCQVYFGVEPEEKLIPLVVEEIGADKLMYASDYPHWDSDWPNTVRSLSERTDLSDEVRQKLMCDNALRFYGLKAPVPA